MEEEEKEDDSAFVEDFWASPFGHWQRFEGFV